LISATEIFFIFGGFIIGLVFILAASFIYFFRADRSILRRMMPVISNPNSYISHLNPVKEILYERKLIHVEWYFESPLRLRRTRDVSHYTTRVHRIYFQKTSLCCHPFHFCCFFIPGIIGFFLDHQFFQLPAAASITIFFSILIGVAGAFSYFLQSWSIPYLIGLILLLNIFYKLNWIDPP
jgi:hypothetical protein